MNDKQHEHQPPVVRPDAPIAGVTPVQDGHRKKRLYVVLGMILLLVVVIVALIVKNAFFVTNNQEMTGESVTITSSDRAVDNVMNTTDGKAVIYVKQTAATGAQTSDGSIIYDFAPYQPDGFEYKTLPASGKGVGFALSAESATSQYTKMNDALRASGLSQKSTDTADAGGILSQKDSTLVSYVVYTSKDTVCSLAHIDASRTVVRQHIVSVGCAEKAAYAEAAQAVAPLYAARNDTQKSSEPQTFALLANEAGAEGYRRAAVFQTKSSTSSERIVSFYYSDAKAQKWTYLTALGSDGMTPCSLYVGDAIKKAFKGTSCYDSSTKAVSVI